MKQFYIFLNLYENHYVWLIAKCYGHDGFVMCVFTIKQYSNFCKYININVLKKKIKEILENNMSTLNRKYQVYGVKPSLTVSYLTVSD